MVWIVGRTVPIHTTTIAYISEHDSTPDLFLVDMPRYIIQQLTRGMADYREPAWSPDGEWLAFVSDEDRDDEIYLLHVYTGQVRQLTHNQVVDNSPAWSPDGQRIAYASTQAGNSDIYIYDLRTDETMQLVSHSGWDNDPAWSPDGQQIIFVSNRDGYGNFYQVSAAGGKVRQVTQNSGWYLNPAWSPDGRWIVFDSADATGADIFLLDTTCLQTNTNCNQAIRQLTHSDRMDGDPSWSPDGQHIVYYSGINSLRYNLVVITANCYQGTLGCENTAKRITDERYIDWSPAWKP
ncbi:MAG: PD40 domain-containing protein [Anaerolineaceae bacterium]|nr:PD40 domain-containing protein [Anaerolineaceae bacterium]